MPLLTNQDQTHRATGTALTYITIGAILTVLSGTSFFFFTSPFEENRILGYIRAVVLILGVVLLVIGLAIGQISRTAATKAEPTAEEQALAKQRPQPRGEAQSTAQ